MGMNGGSQSSGSRPLSPLEMQLAYNFAIANINPYIPSEAQAYQAPAAVTANAMSARSVAAPEYKTLTGQDYDKLQRSIYEGQAAGLDQAWTKRTGDVNNSMAARGMWKSGLAEKALQEEYGSNFAPLYLKAANDAVTQRYALQSDELKNFNNYRLTANNNENMFNLNNAKMLNDFNLGNSSQLNTFNLANAAASEASRWRKPEFLANLWTLGKGQTSNSSGFNVGFNI